MLSESSFSDRALAEEFYASLFDCFCESCEPSVREIFRECTFGMMPDRVGVKTLFIIAPNQFLTQQLKNHTHSIADRVAALMPGIGRVALCFLPPDRDANPQTSCNPKVSQFMMGHIFPIPAPDELS
ncbi:MAG: hypothetical protein D6728_05915 [Cyanobacteria bacterium J055]|nr:MAG: hypothetical protein D6728_05915 [Cyanobacteria bacterium J055]